MENEHECFKKKGLIQETLIDGNGRIFCCGCFKELQQSQVHPKILNELRRNGKLR